MYSITGCLITTGNKRSLLIEDGALPWIVQNANSEASPIRRHIELALCHLAQRGEFAHLFAPFFSFLICIYLHLEILIYSPTMGTDHSGTD